MTLTWFDLGFPLGLDAVAVSTVLRTLAGEPTAGPLKSRSPVVLEVTLTRRRIGWQLGATPIVAGRLRAAAERALPGLTWTDSTHREIEIERAVELRIDSPNRLLAVDMADSA